MPRGRRGQMRAEKAMKAMRAKKAKAAGSSEITPMEKDLFLGERYKRSQYMLPPSFLRWVSKELGTEADMQKLAGLGTFTSGSGAPAGGGGAGGGARSAPSVRHHEHGHQRGLWRPA